MVLIFVFVLQNTLNNSKSYLIERITNTYINMHLKSMCNDNSLIISKILDLFNVNQLLIATTLICDLSEINWFAATNFSNQNVDYLNFFFTRNSKWLALDDEALVNIESISFLRIKVGLQIFLFIDALCKRMNWSCLSWFGTARRWSRLAPLGSSDSCPGRSGRDQPSGSPCSCCCHCWKQ